MKVPEAVLERFRRAYGWTGVPMPDARLNEALEAAMEQLREELEGEEAIKAGSAAAFVEVSALLESDIHSALQAALNLVLGEPASQSEGERVRADDVRGILKGRETLAEAERRKLLEFDAWLSTRGEFNEVLTAFRQAFETDTSAAALDDPNSEYSVLARRLAQSKGGKQGG